VLLPLSWWSRVYSKNHTEGLFFAPLARATTEQVSSHFGVKIRLLGVSGLRKQNYYVTLGQQICESVEALNDETYRNFT
jgi:hypothetical protein